ncbi:ABC transporter permease [Nocardioides carbamazepini]|uniref:ABC transporter permease n=1 Tax=Nocardioides carbamazepini TaxID=2854259 RepID=UPI002149C753|nr:ABC transporter permease [Nocardioides carbamazepini]MCR1784970.1 ABC transporter permease [Nocardioides carbamazepini]
MSRAMRKSILGVAGVVLSLVLWQYLTVGGPLAQTPGLPTASGTFERAVKQAGDPELWSALATTLVVTLAALLIASLLGIGVGLLMGYSKIFSTALDPLVQFLRPVPPVALLPVALLVMGPTSNLAILMAVVTAMWPALVQTLVGVRGVDNVTLDAARAMVLPPLLIQTRIVLLSALPHIATGIRIAASYALLMAIATGILTGAPGLGRSILFAQQAGDSALVFALAVYAGILGLAISQAFSRIEGRLTRDYGPTAEAAAS